MRDADNHAGWAVQMLTDGGWIQVTSVWKHRFNAEFLMKNKIDQDVLWKRQKMEYRVVEALC
jgi:hypothetical protein